MKKCTFVVDKFCFRFKTIDEVIRRANNSAYGLGAGVVTRSVDNAIKIANGLRTGTVYVNCYDVFDRLGEKKKKNPLSFFVLFSTLFVATCLLVDTRILVSEETSVRLVLRDILKTRPSLFAVPLIPDNKRGHFYSLL